MDMIIINDIPITIDFLKEHLEYDVPYTYKNIVDRLGLPYKKTSKTSKESQLKQLSRGLRYEIRNKKYYILEIYDEFEPEGIRSVWSSLIKVQLMCYLRNHEGYSATHSLPCIWTGTGQTVCYHDNAAGHGHVQEDNF